MPLGEPGAPSSQLLALDRCGARQNPGARMAMPPGAQAGAAFGVRALGVASEPQAGYCLHVNSAGLSVFMQQV